ncbi:SpoIID/LytB domain-containing protein [Paenibacillus senegalensis]|uniref:SpoIID/LytB domain-containing protein n=1 Tax=Paenibacillus senegalensis TaxID=1465766 RepID=UPI000288880C|nr:SpoIID/LytB domain-containing protein [Paenibacillus senegalensis]
MRWATKQQRPIGMYTVIAVLLWTSFMMFCQQSASASTRLDKIRVALYIESENYKSTVPTITLSAQQPINGSLRKASGDSLWWTSSQGNQVKASLDEYFAILSENTSYSTVKGWHDQLLNAKHPVQIHAVERGAGRTYQLVIGPYADLAAAQTQAQAAVKAVPSASGGSPVIQGPFRIQAGSYSTAEEARSQLTAIQQNGIAADLVYHENTSGSLVFSVWAGASASQENLNQVISQLGQAFPQLNLTPVDTSKPYLVERLDYSAGEQSPVSYLLLSGNGDKLVLAAGESKLTVEQKSGRTYRGMMELGQYNGKLALINEVPFEEYLYSVVSAEMGTGWPIEALKAQAVAARSYALERGLRYGIAHVTDSTLDQAYDGVEYDDVIQAVEATRGEVLTDGSKVISPLYSSNAGGQTAEPEEVWGNPSSVYSSVSSPDEAAAKGKLAWYRVWLSSGKAGYVRSDLLTEVSQKNRAGLPYYEAKEASVNVRAFPDANRAEAVAKLDLGERVVVFGEVMENTAYEWIRGTYKASELQQMMNRSSGQAVSGPVYSLEVAERGPSGRVTSLKANGKAVDIRYPDAIRTLLGSLPSTLFEIEETGRYTIIGADGATRSYPESALQLHAVDSSGTSQIREDHLFIMDGSGEVRLATQEPAFVFHGKGFGHGLGMSQWGARGLAEQGYSYEEILKHYFQGATLVKD